MSGPIYDFFELVLTSLTDLISDNVYKGLGLSEVVVEEGLEFLLDNKPSGGIFDFSLILLLMI